MTKARTSLWIVEIVALVVVLVVVVVRVTRVPPAPPPPPPLAMLDLSDPATHPSIGLSDFVVTGEDPALVVAARVLADVLWADLDFEHEFSMVPRTASAAIPAAAVDAVPYGPWNDAGAGVVLAGSVSQSGADLVLDVRIVSVSADSRGRQAFAGRYPSCRVEDPRACAHVIADDIHKQVRRIDGVARTKLAFSSDRRRARLAGEPIDSFAVSKEIYVSDYDGANQTRVSANRSINSYPAWSPIGNLLSYVSWASGVPDIYVMNLAQPGPLLRPAHGGPRIQNWTPAWSPDGSKLAFASTRSGNLDVWVVNRDGTGLQNLTSHSASAEGTPTWSPDGAEIAFTSNRTGRNQLYAMTAAGTGERLLVAAQVDRPTWSALNVIAFTFGSGSRYDIAVYDVANPGPPRVLTDGIGSSESPAVAPNGRHIAFVSTRWGRQQVAVMDRDGQNVRRLTEAGNNVSPNWQPLSGQ